MEITNVQMIGHSNILQGLRIIPKDWEILRLGDVLDRLSNGLTYDVSVSEGLPVTRIETISTGEINFSKVGYISQTKDLELYKMRKGDILYSHINSLLQIGKVAYYNSEKELYHGMNLLLLRANNKVTDKYLYYYLLTDAAKRMAQIVAKPAVNQASISTSDLKKVKIVIPPIEEQKKIAEILSEWDKAIELQTKLIEKLELRKRSLMQHLLTGRVRLNGFSAKWKKTSINSFAEEISIKNKNNEPLIVLSCTKYNGLVPSLEYFGKQVYPDDVTKYKIVQKNHFAYATNHIEEGSIGYQTIENRALISPMYTVFCTNSQIINNIYLYALLKTPHLIYLYKSRMEGSIDRRGGLRWESFSSIKIDLPPLAEQTAIVEVLMSADKEIEIAKIKLSSLRNQKRGLMQQLLTGKKRIK